MIKHEKSATRKSATCKEKKGKLQYDRMQHEKSATLNFDHPEVNAVTTLVQKNIKEISSFTA